MTDNEYTSSKLTFALINWVRNNKDKEKLATDLKEAYSYIEQEHVQVNLKEDLPKFYHQFLAALYVKQLALDLIDVGFPVNELYKKYNEHLVWTRDADLSNYIKAKEPQFYQESVSKASISSVPSLYILDDLAMDEELRKNTNVFLRAEVINVIAANIELDKENPNSVAAKQFKANKLGL
jgi:hypothetical protein